MSGRKISVVLSNSCQAAGAPRLAPDNEDGWCPECHGDDLEVIGIRDVRRPPTSGSRRSSEKGPVVARRVDFRCRDCGYGGSMLRRLPSSRS